MKKLYYKPTSKYIQLEIEAIIALSGDKGPDDGYATEYMTHKREPAIEETNSPW